MRCAACKITLALTLCMAFGGAWAGAYDDFFRAVKIDYASEISRLVGKGFDPNSRSEDGQPALIVAIREDSEKVVDVLLDLPQIDIEARNEAGETPLMMAALRGNVRAMRKLIQRGATVQHAGWAPIHYAASHGGMEGIELLLAQGAALDARSPNGTTPLMMAARYGSEEATLLLVRRKADVQLRNDKGLTAAGFARLAQRADLATQIERQAGSATAPRP